MGRRRPPQLFGSVLVALALAGGCASGGADDAAETSGPAVTAPGTTSGPEPTEPATTVAPVAPTTVAAPAPGLTTVPEPAASASPAPEVTAVADPPVTGIPGAESADLFCASYGQLTISVYLLGLSEAFAADPLEARRVEMAAGYNIDFAYRGALDALQQVAPGDAEAFATRWGPYAARAALAITSLGRSELAGELFPERWTNVLATHDRNDPAVDLGIDAATAATLDALVPDFAAQVGPIAEDLAVARGAEVATPGVDAHVVATCPDLAAAASPDAV